MSVVRKSEILEMKKEKRRKMREITSEQIEPNKDKIRKKKDKADRLKGDKPKEGKDK